jgi:hypothetical protein
MDAINLICALASAIAALAAAYVAIVQFKLSQRQHNHDVYERRAVYLKSATEFLRDLSREGRVSIQRVAQFGGEISDADFVLDKETVASLNELYGHGLKIASLYEQLYPRSGEPGLPVGTERTLVCEKASALLVRMLEVDAARVRAAFKRSLAV